MGMIYGGDDIAATLTEAQRCELTGFVKMPPTLAQVKAARIERYRADLKAHDWAYEWSDDGTVYRRGVTERARLMVDAASLDPDFKVWNEVAPAEYRRVLP